MHSQAKPVRTMDSPHLQSSTYPQRVRTNSNLSVNSASYPGGIRKRSTSRSRAISTSQADRLQQLALDDPDQADFQSGPPVSAGLQWITPQHSPQPHIFSEPSNVEPFPQWTVPTPPRSDSGVPTLSVDASEDPATTGVSSSQSFNFETQPTTSAEMRFVVILCILRKHHQLMPEQLVRLPVALSVRYQPIRV